MKYQALGWWVVGREVRAGTENEEWMSKADNSPGLKWLSGFQVGQTLIKQPQK